MSIASRAVHLRAVTRRHDRLTWKAGDASGRITSIDRRGALCIDCHESSAETAERDTEAGRKIRPLVRSDHEVRAPMRRTARDGYEIISVARGRIDPRFERLRPEYAGLLAAEPQQLGTADSVRESEEIADDLHPAET
jgi:hypothetical protein